jgi:aerotaxis receptor
MRNNQPISGREISLPESIRIISTTDPKGMIQYANSEFEEISGFSVAELESQPHNLVRHPDMPPAAFENLWATLGRKKPWLGIVKNRCKNGDHYWVDAFVSPVFEGDAMVGYQSVRVKPKAGHMDRAKKLYERLNKGKSPFPWYKRMGLRARLLAWNLGTLILLLAMFQWQQPGITTPFVAATILGLLLSVAGAHLLSLRLRTAAQAAKSMLDNDLTAAVYGGAVDEVGQLNATIEMQCAGLRTLRGRVQDIADSLANASNSSTETANRTLEGSRTQRSNLEQVATAISQLTTTVQQVAEHVQVAADTSQEIQSDVESGQSLVVSAAEIMQRISEQTSQAANTIEELRSQSLNIGSVVDVIRDISEQTNLLALNAAIEAARAGEHGRGFAVVADEVRGLATRTQESTGKIQSIVENLQSDATKAVATMQDSKTIADEGAGSSSVMVEALSAIERHMATIVDMISQVATAADEQSYVAEDINQNTISINSVAEETSQLAHQSVGKSQELNQMVIEMRSIIRQFSMQ